MVAGELSMIALSRDSAAAEASLAASSARRVLWSSVTSRP